MQHISNIEKSFKVNCYDLIMANDNLMEKLEVTDKTVVMPCSFWACVRKKVIEVPQMYIDVNNEAKREYRHQELIDGIYASQQGAFYCCRDCWSDNTSD